MGIERLYKIADKDNISIEYFPMKKEKALSFEEGYIAINSLLNLTSVDEKVTLAHELGHCETGSFYNVYSDFDIKQKHENKADAWAIKTLIPFYKLKKAWSQGYVEYWQLAEYFDVPGEFIEKVIEYYRRKNLI